MPDHVLATHTMRIYQAQGMVSVQAGCTFECALERLARRAVRDDSTLEDVALAVVERKIRWAPS